MSAARDFAELGEDMLRLVAALARTTRGDFPGQAGTVLATARTFSQAGMNGFLALAASSRLTEAQALSCSQAARFFRDALGVMATHFAGGNTVVSLRELGLNDRDRPNRLASFFADGTPPLVSVSITARQALDSLSRDPLELAELPQEALLGLLAAVVAGVRVASP